MSTTPPGSASRDRRSAPVAGAPGRTTARADAWLASGRCSRALWALRRLPRRPCDGDQAAHRALREADALRGLLRFREALGVVGRALARRPREADLVARLRIERAWALWHTGAPSRAVCELRRAETGDLATVTRGRLAEARGFVAWKAGDAAGAGALLGEARRCYAARRHAAGLARVLAAEAGRLRDAGRFEEALETLERRADLARSDGRVDGEALARADRGDLLAYLGRWEAAREELARSAELFGQVEDPREHTLAGLRGAMVSLARGDLSGASEAVRRACEIHDARGGGLRDVAETRLVSADLKQAQGLAAGSDADAADALRLFSLAQDRDGECRARVRRCHALLESGRHDEALREARRARRAARRDDLAVLADVAIGRALLRTDRPAAAAAFDRAARRTESRPALAAVARLGGALALGRGGGAVAAELTKLEAFGDGRLLAYVLADARRFAWFRAEAGPCPVPGDEVGDAVAEERTVTALIESAETLASGRGDPEQRWTRAMRLVAPALPWHRVALVGSPAWLLRQDLETPIPLPADDPAWIVAAGAQQPARIDLGARSDTATHPARALHRLGCAIVAPIEPGLVLYLDAREGEPAPSLERAVAFARLLAASGVAPAAAPAPASVRPDAGLLGRSPALAALRVRIAEAAACELTVHVVGETGTGKERVAHALHAASRRRDAPFVAVNVAGLSDELFESELFGHVRGAFTGAVADRRGCVGEAEGGTLFLDEIADLSPRAQAKLLRFVQLKEYRRVGEAHVRHADVRIVTAANVALRERVAAGRFREDLMYRLCVVVLELPPLRQRGEDVVLLARHFLAEAAAAAGRPVPPLSDGAAAALRRYAWPGNVRELENMMGPLVAFARGPRVEREDLDPALGHAAPRGTLREALARHERALLDDALARHAGNRTRAAADLGISRQALLAKLARLGL